MLSSSDHAGTVYAGTTVLIVGDSLTSGAGEVREREIVQYISPSFVEIVSAALPHMKIIPDAQLHRTTDDVRNQIEPLLSLHRPNLVLLMIGANDADLDWRRFMLTNGSVARNRVGVDRYLKNLQQICQKIMAAGARPILADMANHQLSVRGKYVSQQVGRDITPLLEAGGGQKATDLSLAQYRQGVRKLAHDMNLNAVWYGPVLASRPVQEVTSPDGAHPSAAGHRLIADVVIAALQRAALHAPAQVSA